LPALLGVAAIPLAYGIGSELGGRRAGLLTALLLATSAVHAYYSQEARAYTLLGAAAALAVLGCLRFLAANDPPPPEGVSRRGLGPYALGTAVALYAHNTAAFLPGIANLAALAWWWARARRDRHFLAAWLLANLLPCLLWLPWLPVLLGQARGAPTLAWLEQPDLPGAVRDVFRLYGLRYLPAPAWLDLAAPVALLALWGAFAAPRRPLALVAFAFAALVPALTFLAGLAGQPLWVERTLLWPLPLGLALVAVGLLAVRPRPLRLALLALVAAIQAANLWGLHALPQKPPMAALAADLARDWRGGDGLLLLPQGIQFSAAYYLHRHGRPLEALGLGEGPARVAPNPLALARPLAPPVGRPVAYVSAPMLPALLPGRFRRAWLLVRRRDRLDPDGRVMAQLAALGRVAELRRYPPFLELIRVDLAP
jgi:4-amino-4-deoxy-L-arabinose transferase-like glycosyltransferase